MECKATKSGAQWRGSLSGVFNHETCRSFGKVVDGPLKDGEVKTITLDLAALTYLDSSALGALLILREKAGRLAKTVELRAATGNVRKVLEIANFNRLFSVS